MRGPSQMAGSVSAAAEAAEGGVVSLIARELNKIVASELASVSLRLELAFHDALLKLHVESQQLPIARASPWDASCNGEVAHLSAAALHAALSDAAAKPKGARPSSEPSLPALVVALAPTSGATPVGEQQPGQAAMAFWGCAGGADLACEEACRHIEDLPPVPPPSPRLTRRQADEDDEEGLELDPPLLQAVEDDDLEQAEEEEGRGEGCRDIGCKHVLVKLPEGILLREVDVLETIPEEEEDSVASAGKTSPWALQHQDLEECEDEDEVEEEEEDEEEAAFQDAEEGLDEEGSAEEQQREDDGRGQELEWEREARGKPEEPDEDLEQESEPEAREEPEEPDEDLELEWEREARRTQRAEDGDPELEWEREARKKPEELDEGPAAQQDREALGKPEKPDRDGRKDQLKEWKQERQDIEERLSQLNKVLQRVVMWGQLGETRQPVDDACHEHDQEEEDEEQRHGRARVAEEGEDEDEALRLENMMSAPARKGWQEEEDEEEEEAEFFEGAAEEEVPRLIAVEDEDEEDEEDEEVEEEESQEEGQGESQRGSQEELEEEAEEEREPAGQTWLSRPCRKPLTLAERARMEGPAKRRGGDGLLGEQLSERHEAGPGSIEDSEQRYAATEMEDLPLVARQPFRQSMPQEGQQMPRSPSSKFNLTLLVVDGPPTAKAKELLSMLRVHSQISFLDNVDPFLCVTALLLGGDQLKSVERVLNSGLRQQRHQQSFVATHAQRFLKHLSLGCVPVEAVSVFVSNLIQANVSCGTIACTYVVPAGAPWYSRCRDEALSIMEHVCPSMKIINCAAEKDRSASLPGSPDATQTMEAAASSWSGEWGRTRPGRFLQVDYSTFWRKPQEEVRRILDFMEANVDQPQAMVRCQLRHEELFTLGR